VPGFNSRQWRSISRDFSLADHTLPTRPEPAWQKIAQSPLNGATQRVDSEEGRSPTWTDDGWGSGKIKYTNNSVCAGPFTNASQKHLFFIAHRDDNG